MNFLALMDYSMEKPTTFGWFHLVCIFIIVILSVITAKIGRKKLEKNLDKTVFIFGVFFLLDEIIKQILFTEANNWVYPIYIFPFQLCSIPTYVSLIAPWIKKDTLRKACYTFLAFADIGGGIATVIFAEYSVFGVSIFGNIHTMVWHCSMIVQGVYLIAATQLTKKSLKDIFQGYGVFLFFLLVAEIMNVGYYYIFYPTLGGSFNMFFVSPFFPGPFIIGYIWTNFGWIAALIAYILATLLGCLIIYYGLRLISNLKSKRKIEQSVKEN